MSNTQASDIKTPDEPIIKTPVAFSNDVIAIAIHKSIVRRLGISEDTQIQEEVVDGVGILLRIVTKLKDTSVLRS